GSRTIETTTRARRRPERKGSSRALTLGVPAEGSEGGGASRGERRRRAEHASLESVDHAARGAGVSNRRRSGTASHGRRLGPGARAKRRIVRVSSGKDQHR